MSHSHIPELMSPAGNWECARAAVDNGADAIYFGLQDGFNARARAANFTVAELPKLMAYLRALGIRGYATLNTLVFPDELAEAERLVSSVAEAGVDAVLVQDLGLLRLIHEICPDLPLHASTQMTLSSAECIRQAQSLGVRRVVLPRELSIEQVAAIRRESGIELEVFVHGALCISYSGQCLASVSLGGRSANRGQCAQPCRLPYEVLGTVPIFAGTDAQRWSALVAKMGLSPSAIRTAGKRYPLSPHDLAAYDRLPELAAAGVSALKIEGRLKSAEYVACVTRHYRTVLDGVCGVAGPNTSNMPETADLERAFSRGFCHGWLDGNDHRALVSGDQSAHRGTYLGVVKAIRGRRVLVELAAPILRGDGVLFESAEQGGRVYEVFQGKRSIAHEVSAGQVELAFRYGAIDFATLEQGGRVWKTDDPRAAKRLQRSAAGAGPRRRVAVDVTVEAAVGSPLCVTAVSITGASYVVESTGPLAQATKHRLTREVLAEQFGRLGNTNYLLRRLDASIDGQPMAPLSVLGQLRHEIVRQLDAAAAVPPRRTIAAESVLPELRRLAVNGASVIATSGGSHLHVLCRCVEQVEAALSCGVSSIIIDFSDLQSCGDAIELARSGGAEAWVATPRIHKPGEDEIFGMLARCRPDGILVRNLAGLAYFRERKVPVVADFSLNAANELTVDWLLSQGALRVTTAYDLSAERLVRLAGAVAAERLEVVVHRHAPMFHTEYCLYCATLSQGKNDRDCGRPCQRETLRLRDRLGVEHPVLVDHQCRNTVFHAKAENLSRNMPKLQRCGIRHFRVELLEERQPDQVRQVIETVGYASA